ncbi:hypothetical protein POSPLADRAFT_1142484 [Postia placenta MAD-698-R-SB12]|uniref:RRM domain-containing protein n=1 Tax=Postia placenta MAD-698-R-SB12 TaxID=670580 RepID=A0A1X6N072_9APHY|nr:hypothetical protein POSPLADRAFT_1142484 [Postia placenta MAD-698-R-SB12]OSX62018.1 hypothetical protein POSPLADRAFT_1142484 [Postia placenta MAD-698-R-SB12]
MSTLLGKRKEREADEPAAKHHGSTLFVSNLPYTATSIDLNTLFSDIAPVRSAFVVLDQASGVSKGVGYVSFAIREDAQLAYEQINQDGLILDSRNLRVQWAESKYKEKTQKEPMAKSEPMPKPPRPAQTNAPRDPLAIRTVAISGLPSSVDSKQLWKKIRKLDGAEKVDWPITSANGDEDRSTAHALFTTPAAAADAVNKLHAHVFKGSLLSATLKKRLDGLAKAPKTAKAANPKGPAPNRASRLIVRNLPFNISEQDLRALFLPYGPIHSVDIPSAVDDAKEEDGEATLQAKRGKGFAFVWMLSRKDAERAMEECNGMKVQAGMAARLANERVIAVDWALSKDKWEQEKAKIEPGQEDADINMVDVKSEKGSESGSESESDTDEDEQLGVHDGDSDNDSRLSDSDDGDESEAEDEKPSKPVLPPPDVGTTLFVRNVPFEATEDELRTLFRAFGPLRYARITLDYETGRSRGTGFACFWNKEDADKAIEQSDILRAETAGDRTAQPKKNPFKMPSLLTPDPSASVAQNLVLHGRTLDVVRAVTRDEAGKLKEAGEKQREKADKRNLYLLREGIILPNTPAAEGMSAADVEKRTQSYNARRALLRSNPSLYVSRTRLSIRQLPLFVTERMLKRLAIHAVRTFDKEVKEGARQSLSEDELDESAPTLSEETPVKEESSKTPGRKGKGGRATGVKQTKIVRQADRVDPVTGKGRSKGYGFLEMIKHADALRVLRWANNNTEAGRLFEEWWKAEVEDLIKIEKKKPTKDDARIKRLKEELERGAPVKSRGTLIVEFSIENVQVVQRRTAQQREKQQVITRKVSLPDIKSEPAEERSPKKRRMSAPKLQKQSLQKQSSKDAAPKSGHQVGSLIGRKRKERKSKKGAS